MQIKFGKVAKKIKRISEKGVTLIEGLVSTAIIGIGFVAVFQMTQYSVRSIDVSGERTKATYLTGMIVEDLYAEKNQETSGTKFMDSLAATPWELKQCDDSGSTNIPYSSFTGSHSDYKKKKWSSRFSRNFIKCRIFIITFVVCDYSISINSNSCKTSICNTCCRSNNV